MTSLSEAYDDRGGTRSLRRLYLGVGLFVGGVLLLVAGIVAAGTSALTSLGYSLGEARLWGGILGGIGVPAVMLGVFTVLPSGRTTKAAALVGVGLSLLGVALFSHAYPYHWIGGPRPELVDLTLPTAGLYFLGTATTFWCLFVGVANFKTRNDPGGTVEMEVTHKGETKIVEIERDRLSGLGGIGFLGNTPDGDVETQTNAPAESTASSDGGSTTETLTSPLEGEGPSAPTARTEKTTDGREDNPRSQSAGRTTTRRTETSVGSTPGPTGGTGSAATKSGGAGYTGTKSGGTTGASRRSNGATDAERDGVRGRRSAADHYCGSCQHFDYVRTEQGMQPYCGLDDEVMDSMDACDEWTPRSR